MDETLLRSEIGYWEGNVGQVYKDTLGNLTVGIGHMDNNMVLGQHVSPSVVDMFYKQDSAIALQIAQKYIRSFDQLDPVRQRLMVSLAFNLGNKLGQFTHMIAAIDTQQWNRAADELQRSLWYGQVGRRGAQSVEILRTGTPLKTK